MVSFWHAADVQSVFTEVMKWVNDLENNLEILNVENEKWRAYEQCPPNIFHWYISSFALSKFLKIAYTCQYYQIIRGEKHLHGITTIP